MKSKFVSVLFVCLSASLACAHPVDPVAGLDALHLHLSSVVSMDLRPGLVALVLLVVREAFRSSGFLRGR